MRKKILALYVVDNQKPVGKIIIVVDGLNAKLRFSFNENGLILWEQFLSSKTSSFYITKVCSMILLPTLLILRCKLIWLTMSWSTWFLKCHNCINCHCHLSANSKQLFHQYLSKTLREWFRMNLIIYALLVKESVYIMTYEPTL